MALEHIHPQSMLDDVWSEKVVGQIGNLLLVTDATNVALGTKSFENKKKQLTKDGHSIADFLQKTQVWSVDSVYDHTELLATLGYEEIWKI